MNQEGMISKASSTSALDGMKRLIAGRELRTPLTGILGLAHILNQDADDLSAAEVKNFSAHILESGKKLLKLSDRISTWLSLSGTAAIRDPQPFFISSGWIEAIIMSQLENCFDDAELLHFKSEIASCTIYGEDEYIKIAIGEILNNALKYRAPGTIVSIKTFVDQDNFFVEVTNRSNCTTPALLNAYQAFNQINNERLGQQGIGLGLELIKLALWKCNTKIEIVNGNAPMEISFRAAFHLYKGL